MSVADDLIAAFEPWLTSDLESYERLLYTNLLPNPSNESGLTFTNSSLSSVGQPAASVVVTTEWSKVGESAARYTVTRDDGVNILLRDGTGAVGTVPVEPGHFYAARMSVHLESLVGAATLDDWRGRIYWYKQDGTAATDSTADGAILANPGVGAEEDLFLIGLAPSDAAFGGVAGLFNMPAGVVTMVVDGDAGMLVDLGPDFTGPTEGLTSETDVPVYFDGDQLNGRWTGTPHASPSELYAAGDPLRDYLRTIGEMFAEVELYSDDTDEFEGWTILLDVDRAPAAALPYLAQYVGERIPVGITEEAARQWIRDAPNQRRGTLQSIVDASQRYLTGGKNVTVIQRDGGPDKLTVVSYTPETPDSARVLAELMTVVPADISLTYVVSAGQIWSQVIAVNPDWNDVMADYDTWADVMAGTPSGTYG